MKNLILLFQIIISVTLIVLILLQSSRGGLGSAFGGGTEYRTKRGAENLIFKATIATAVLFFIISVTSLLIR